MRLSVESLTLFCREGDETVTFGSRLSFFHGEMSAGKSTIPELIDYCFGARLVKTPAISSELIRVQLSAQLGVTAAVMERSPDTRTVEVSWEEPSQSGREALPLAAAAQPIIEPDVHNLSDFLLSKLGQPVIKVRKRTDDPGSELVRLSFRDLFEFSYLHQDDLDSSFFFLEQPVRAEKSKDALRFFVGFFSARLAELEGELARLRQEQRTKREAAKQITEFLERFGFGSEEQIAREIATLAEEQVRIQEQNEQLRSNRLPEISISEEMRERADRIATEQRVVAESVEDLKQRIGEQEALAAEFVSMKVKAARSQLASELLQGARFQICPACGTPTDEEPEPGRCHLCGKPPAAAEPFGQLPRSVIEQDLNDRIDDLKASVARLKRALARQTERQEKLRSTYRAIGEQIAQNQRLAESEVLARARDYESRLGALKERIVLLNRIKQMPSEIERVLREADAMTARMLDLRRQIEAEEEKLEEAEANIRALETNFALILKSVGFPGFSEGDRIAINRKTWNPRVYPKNRDDLAWSFEDAGSGGKKVLFKICFALALHVTASQRNLPVPRILIIDSVMKNIDPSVNREIFESFYDCLFDLMQSDMKEWQVILVDQTYRAPPPQLGGLVERFMTKDDPEHPPLISYYRGP